MTADLALPLDACTVTGMNDRRTTGLPANNESAIAAFQAEVARLMALSPESFAELQPGALAPLVATIRATPREVTAS